MKRSPLFSVTLRTLLSRLCALSSFQGGKGGRYDTPPPPPTAPISQPPGEHGVIHLHHLPAPQIFPEPNILLAPSFACTPNHCHAEEGPLRTSSSEKPFPPASYLPHKGPAGCRDPQISGECIRKTYHCGKEPENLPLTPNCLTADSPHH